MQVDKKCSKAVKTLLILFLLLAPCFQTTNQQSHRRPIYTSIQARCLAEDFLTRYKLGPHKALERRGKEKNETRRRKEVIPRPEIDNDA